MGRAGPPRPIRRVLLVDNVLWSGRVVEPANPDTGGTEPVVADADTVALRAFNDKVADDSAEDKDADDSAEDKVADDWAEDKVAGDSAEVVILTAFDGLTIARKL